MFFITCCCGASSPISSLAATESWQSLCVLRHCHHAPNPKPQNPNPPNPGRASARTVTAIIPYYGYSRQDEKRRPRVPIAASDIAMLMEAAGVDRILSVDLHSGQIQGQFQHCPVDNLSMFEDFAVFFVKHLLPTFPEGSEVAVVSPDADGTARAKFFLGLLIERGECDAKQSQARHPQLNPKPFPLGPLIISPLVLAHHLGRHFASCSRSRPALTLPQLICMFNLARRGKRVACHHNQADHFFEHPLEPRRRGRKQGVHHHRRHHRHWSSLTLPNTRLSL
jgi:hypothetical protein